MGKDTSQASRLVRAQILEQAFARAKKQNPAFSLRALAKKLELSPGFVSKVLSGKIDLPFQRVNDFVAALRMDKVSENRLLRTMTDAKTERLSGLAAANSKVDDVMQGYVEVGERQFVWLSKWFYIPVLDLSTHEDFEDRTEWVASRLSISKTEAQNALELLKQQGYLIQDEAGRWRKRDKHLRFPTKESREPIRKYHELLLKKAIEHLRQFHMPEDFDRRLMTGIWIAANPEQMQKAQAKLHEAMYEIASILSQGECSDIYYLSSQLFPVTKKSTK